MDAGTVLTEVVDDLRARRFEAVAARFGPNLAAQLPVERLSATWDGLIAQVGDVVAVEPASVDGAAAIAKVAFGATTLEVVVQIGASGALDGLVIRQPTPTEVPWVAPGYDDQRAYEVVKVEVGSDPALPGTLRIPRKGRPVPAVVILHGSGPSDADGTVNTVKPYRDLACGLASAGVAALTFEKRTKVAPASLPADGTLEDEVLADARAALAVLAERPEIDGRRIVVVGHSLGAFAAPRLVQDGAQVAGLVLLCAPTRSLDVLALEQIRFQAAQPGRPSEAQMRQALRLEEPALEALAGLRRGEVVEAPLPMGLPASYWRDVDATDPVATAASLGVPVHVIHGGRDAQVTEPDLARWQETAAAVRHVTVSVHKRCNHLLVEGRGGPRFEPYDDFGHVSKAVVKEVADLVRKLPPL